VRKGGKRKEEIHGSLAAGKREEAFLSRKEESGTTGNWRKKGDPSVRCRCAGPQRGSNKLTGVKEFHLKKKLSAPSSQRKLPHLSKKKGVLCISWKS